MSDAVTADITIAAPPQKVWELVMDPHRLKEWVSIHKKLESADDGRPHKGMQMRQKLVLRHTSFHVTWELTECKPCELAKWEGKGPARATARTEYHLTENADGGTDFHYVNEFTAPLGPLGKAASKALVGGLPKREAEKSLAQLKKLLDG